MQTNINKKVIIFLSILFLLFIFILCRLFFIQILHTDYFLRKGEKNFLRTEQLPAIRGNILDCHGNILVTNKPIINLYWQGTGNKKLTDIQLFLLEYVENLLQVNFNFSEIQKNETSYKKFILLKNLDPKQLGTLLESIPEHPNLVIITEFQRYYPFKNFASHILGYLKKSNEYESHGKMGLELLCDPFLKGKEGTLQKIINSKGENINIIPIQEPLFGSDIKTTLDINLQSICEQVFPADYSGSIILMDPCDGNIKALVSKPDFNPEIFLYPLSSHAWKSLQIKNPFVNRAFNACFPPGSIFKLVTVSAALEQKLLSENEIFTCIGYVYFCNRKYWCNKKSGHGPITVKQSIAQSCNDLFFKIGRIIDIDTLAYYAAQFGLGRPTSIIFPEKVGLVPSHDWKKKNKGEQWWPGETLSVTIGQSFLLVTPLQIARMISAIFTGYLVKPRILEKESIDKVTCSITQETRHFLKKGMHWAVKKGTGTGVTTTKDFEIYAKTSTAQTSTKNKRHLGKNFLEHGWFVAYFKYKNHNPLVLVILVEHAGSAQVAKKVAQKLLIEYHKMANYWNFKTL